MPISTPSDQSRAGWAAVRRGSRRKGKRMYVQHSVHIDQSVKACTEALISGAGKWFPRLGAKNVGAVGIHVAGVPVRKRVVVELGEPVKTETWTVLPVSWKATFPEQLFPEMTGR